MSACEAGHDTADEFFIIADLDLSVYVDDSVIPRRYLSMELVLARVPVWGNVGISGTKDDQSFIAIFDFFPYGICTSDMRKKLPALARLGI
jgi:hypothetical protein